MWPRHISFTPYDIPPGRLEILVFMSSGYLCQKRKMDPLPDRRERFFLNCKSKRDTSGKREKRKKGSRVPCYPCYNTRHKIPMKKGKKYEHGMQFALTLFACLPGPRMAPSSRSDPRGNRVLQKNLLKREQKFFGNLAPLDMIKLNRTRYMLPSRYPNGNFRTGHYNCTNLDPLDSNNDGRNHDFE